jgi:hypothetical protein
VLVDRAVCVWLAETEGARWQRRSVRLSLASRAKGCSLTCMFAGWGDEVDLEFGLIVTRSRVGIA